MKSEKKKRRGIMMTDYSTRQDFSTIEVLTGEDVDKVKKVLAEIAVFGYDSFQWSSFSQPMNKPGTYERFLTEHPNYKTLPENEKTNLFRSWSNEQSDWYFIEGFGKQFIRGEGETMYDCALVILEKAKKIENCTGHIWEYTHSNGHKTCRLCKRFAPCTVEETLANYKKGHVELDEHKTLEFDHENPMCTCGSHTRHFLADSIMPDKYYRCTECKSYLDEETESPLIPESFEEHIREFYAFDTDSLLSEEQWKKILLKFTNELIKHAKYVEEMDLDNFVSWSKQHYQTFCSAINSTISKEEKQYLVIDIKDLKIEIDQEQILSLSFSLVSKPVDENKLTKEENVRNGFLGLAKAFSDDE